MLIHIARVLIVLSLFFGSAVIGTIAVESSELKSLQVAATPSEADVDLTNRLKQADCLSQRYNVTRLYSSVPRDFDDRVRAAVIRLQRQSGLLVDGIPGSKTRNALTNGKRCSFSKTELDEIFSLFKSGKRNDTVKASVTLNAIGELAKGSIPDVINRLKSNDPIESYIAAGILLVIAEEKVTIPIFINLLKSDKANDRFIGTFFLQDYFLSDFLSKNENKGNLRDALPNLIALVPDDRSVKRSTVSYWTASVLGSMGSDAYAAIPALIDQLDFKRFQLNRPLNNGSVEAIADALSSIFSNRRYSFPTTEDILQGLTSNNQKIRRAAVFLIGYKNSVEKNPKNIDKRVLNKLLEIVKNPSEDMELRKTSAISLIVFKEDVSWFYTENNLISILNKWKECPRSRSEARSGAQNGSVAMNKNREVSFFNPSQLSCTFTAVSDQGDSLGSWFDWLFSK